MGAQTRQPASGRISRGRRSLLRCLLATPAVLLARAGRAAPEDEVIAGLRAEGFEIVEVNDTMLGRVQIIAENATTRREVVVDPSTGEIVRDLSEGK